MGDYLEIYRKIVKETIDKNNFLELLFKEISDDEIKKQTVSYKDIINIITIGNPLSKNKEGYIFESFGDIKQPDDVIKIIRGNYHLSKWQCQKVEAHNNIDIYVIVPNIEENVKLINDDMEHLGYFMGTFYPIEHKGVEWVRMQFEPLKQQTETEKIKQECRFLYHWSNSKNKESILKNGLIPKSENLNFRYPDRIYLLKNTTPWNIVYQLGYDLYKLREDDGLYTLFKIDLHNINKINLFLDCNHPFSVFTEDRIEPNVISIEFETDFNKPYF